MEKILIVDDVKMSQRILEDLIKPHYDVLLATNGQEAYDTAKKEKPDLILMDIIMPVMDGLEATRLLKEDLDTKHIPIIFITAIDKINHIVKAFEIGGVDYIVKPYNELEVLSRVNTQIKLQKYQKQILELERKNSILAMIVTANHELRQPLTILKGYLDLHLSTIEDKNCQYDQKHIIKINDSIDQMINLLNKYRDCTNFDIDEYMSNDDYKMKIAMVKFKEE